MVDELENFQTTGQTWQERAENNEGLLAVYSPNDLIRSQWISLVSGSCLEAAIHRIKPSDTVLDFGCGIGQHTKTLSLYATHTLGVDITLGMLNRARSTYIGQPIEFTQIDGINLPVKNETIDLIWVCDVLRYSLLVPNPKHRDIVLEFLRVLKPGGLVFSYEMYVNQPSTIFSKDFLDSGFHLISKKVVHVQWSRLGRLATGRLRTIFLQKWWANVCVGLTKISVREERLDKRLRDYLFIYQKIEEQC
jgi:ubiquinone/menaquinone biosynthesis C-methylase UbiE